LVGLVVASISPSVATLLVIAIAITIALPLVVRAVQGKFDPFEPILFFALSYGTMFVVRPATMIGRDEYYFLFAPYLDIRATFDEMLVLALLGALAFVLGYFLPLGRQLAWRAPPPPLNFDSRRVVVASLVAVSVGVVAFALFLARGGGLSGLGVVLGGRTRALQSLILETPKYLFYGSLLLVGPAVVLSALTLERKSFGLAALATAVVTLTIVVRGSYGSRIALLPLLGGIVIYWYLHRERRPRATALVVAAVVSLTLSAAIYHGRADTETTEGGYIAGLQTALTSPSAVLDPIVEGPDAAMAPGVAAAMVVVPERLRHTYGLTVVADLGSRGIPRHLWAGKPRPAHDKVTEEIAPRAGKVSYAIAYSVLLHAYLDWGLFGMLWLVGYGILARLGFEWFRLYRSSMPARVLFSLGVLLLVPALRDGPVDTLFLAAAMLIPVWLAFRVAARPVEEHPPVALAS